MIMESEANNKKGELIRGIRVVVFCIIMGAVSCLVFSLQSSNWPQFVSVFAVAIGVSSAAMLTGGMVGFLFGIPKSLQQDSNSTEGADGEEGKSGKKKEIGYMANTNLEQISDWLTKILVGVGLTQLIQVPSTLKKYSEFIAPALGDFPSSKVFAICLLLYFVISGFLVAYLWTRGYLAGALRMADIAAIGGKIQSFEHKVSELEKQIELDARALAISQRQMHPRQDNKEVDLNELNESIINASTNVRAQIFYQAQAIRSTNWKDPATKPVMERTIPIFRALIASDTENIYHANHAQLGFALKDQRTPDYKEAEEELTRAIEIRGPWRESGGLLYEYVRAICRINLDPAFAKAGPSEDSVKRSIREDLTAATSVPSLASLMKQEPDIVKWMNNNGLKFTALKLPIE
jgi:hypothetical protein